MFTDEQLFDLLLLSGLIALAVASFIGINSEGTTMFNEDDKDYGSEDYYDDYLDLMGSWKPIQYLNEKHPEALLPAELSVGMRVAYEGKNWSRGLGTITELDEKKFKFRSDCTGHEFEFYPTDAGVAPYPQGWNPTNRLTKLREGEV